MAKGKIPYDQLSVRAKRKIRRRQENDLYAKDARFWMGKLRSADRMLYENPVNKQALKELNFVEKKKK